MYCYTYLNQLACVFNELQLWTHISSEHPNFLKTVAALSNVNLPKATEDKLDDINKMFLELYNNVVSLKKSVDNCPYISLYAQHIEDIKTLIDEFLLHDTHALTLYPQLLSSVAENETWSALVNHIISEQTFMFELFKDLRQQLI